MKDNMILLRQIIKTSIHLLVLSQTFDSETLCSLQKPRKTILIYADLAMINEFDNPRQLFIFDILQDDDWVLPLGKVTEDLRNE